MKKLFRRLGVAITALIVGVGSVSADTTLLSSSYGWEKVTSLSDVSNYFYVIVDNTNDLMIGIDGTQVKYQTSADPASNLNKVWAFEANGSSYGIRNLSSTKLLVQTEWQAGYNINLNDQPNVCEWTNLNFAYANGVWTIENGKYTYVSETANDSSPYPGYLGPWDGAGKEANGQRIAGNKNKANWGNFQIYRITRSRFLSLYIAAHTKPVDVSFYVAGLTNSTSNWTRNYSGFDKNYQAQRSNNKNTDSYSNWGYLESWNNGVTFTGTLTATLNNLPDGLYDIGAYCFKETSDVVSFTAGSQSVALGDTDNKYQYVSVSKEEVAWEGTDANTKTIGLNITGGTWLGITDVRLTYYGSVQLSDVAIELPANGDMLAGQWYYVDIAVAANNYKATATTLANIVYTTDGTVLRKEDTNVTTQFTVTDNNLSATRYYVKSSTANNLVIEAAAYTYSVGTATVSHNYVQDGETVTITWENASTNDPGASFAMNGTPTITFGGNSVSVNPTSEGFTFTIPATVTAGTDYTLSIPDNAFGYAAGHAYNTAQDITIKTPAVFDGTYFFKDNNDKFWLRGEPYGSAVQVYDWGMPVKVSTDALGATTLQFADASDWKIFSDGTGIYADNASPANGIWHMTVADGKYKFQNAVNNHFMKVDGTRILSTATEEEATAFTMVTPSDHQTVLTNYINAQATTAASGASLNATTPAALATAVDGWNETVVVEGSSAATTAEKWQGGQWDSRTVYSNTVNVTIPGLYKFTMQGFYRMTDNNATYALHTAGADCPPVYVFFGDAKTPIKSVMDESRATAYTGNNCDYAQGDNHYPNQQASSLVAFQEGKYTNTVWAYISTAGEYTYGIQYLGWAGSHSEWTCYTTESISLTLYSQDLWPSLQAALQTYAPYSDIAAADDATGYTTQYNVYAAYTQSTSQSDMQAAITYMQTYYPNYQWANASIAHPVDVTEGIIQNAACGANNDHWTGIGRATATLQYNGTDRTVFYATGEGMYRYQDVTIEDKGAYLLQSHVNNTGDDRAWMTIAVSSNTETTNAVVEGDDYTTTSGYTNGWVENDVFFTCSADNQTRRIKILPSNGSNTWSRAYMTDMHLYYIGQNADFVKDGVHKYIGTYSAATILAPTDAAPIVDVTAATFSTAPTISLTSNPNGLIYAAESQNISAGTNIVKGTTCQSLVLADNHPFVNTKEFTATNAQYTLTNGASDGESSYFATMMIPFASTTSGEDRAYTLNQGVNIYSGVITGTATTQIAANSPVLVKSSSSLANKQFTASNVTVPVAASGATFTNGELVGTYTAIQAPVGSYVMQMHDRLAFYIVGSTRPTVNPFRAYIKSQSSGAKSLTVVFDDVNGIEGLFNEQSSALDGADVYSVGGARQNNLKKGVNIVRMSDGNVRKVVVK